MYVDEEPMLMMEPELLLRMFESTDTGLQSYAVVSEQHAILIDLTEDVADDVEGWLAEVGAHPVACIHTSGRAAVGAGEGSEYRNLVAELGLFDASSDDAAYKRLMSRLADKIVPVEPWDSGHSEPRLVLAIGEHLVELDPTCPAGAEPVYVTLHNGSKPPPVLSIQDLRVQFGLAEARVIPLDGRAQRLAVRVGSSLFSGDRGASPEPGFMTRLRAANGQCIEYDRQRVQSRRRSADRWRPGRSSVHRPWSEDIGEDVPDWAATPVAPFDRRDVGGVGPDSD